MGLSVQNEPVTLISRGGDMRLDIRAFVGVRALDGAQRISVLERLATNPAGADVPGLLAAVEGALTFEWALVEKRRQRERASEARHAPGATELDRRADDLLAVLHGRLKLSVRLSPPPGPV